jgi:putative ABC transport system permease protein
MLRTLAFITFREWRIHKFRLALTVLGIILGVSVFFALRTANTTLLDSLKLTVEKLSGRATLQVTAGESGFPEEILATVRETPGVKVAEPVIEVIAHTAFENESNLLIVGVDTGGDQQLREYVLEDLQSAIGDPLEYISQPDSILISQAFAKRHGLKRDDQLPLYTSQGRKEFKVRGVFQAVGMGEVYDGQIAIIDIYAAQQIFNRGRSFDRIDLISDPETPVETVKERLRQRLPSGLDVSRPASRGQSIENAVATMSQGFILTSLVALLVGVFIIYNSFTIAINQRWKEIGILRSLGVERFNVKRMYLAEALLIGSIGSAIGIFTGFYLAVGASYVMSFIAATTYGYVSEVGWPLLHTRFVIEAFLLGLTASVVAVWIPARAASHLDPVRAMQNVEVRHQAVVLGWPRLLAGLGLIVAGVLLIRFTTPRVGMILQFSYAALALFGLILLLPKLTELAARVLRPLMNRLFGSEGALAVDAMLHAPQRTSATIGALMISLSFVFSTGAFIQSQKQVILGSYDRTINSDVFVTATDLARSRTYHFGEELGQRVAAIPGVKRIENVRFTFVPFRGDNVAIVAIEIDGWFARVNHIIEEGDEATARASMPRGEGVMISRNFSTRWGVRVGDRLRLETPTRPFDQPVLGIIEDYSSEKGTILMDRALYKSFWKDSAVDFIDINLNAGIDRDAFKAELKRTLAGEQRAFIYTNAEYKRWVTDLIDQFFLFNYMQMLVATFIAVIGIINTLIISVSERRREIGIIRAVGGLRRQIRKMVLLEAGVIAVIGILTGALKSIFDTYFLVRTAAAVIGGYTIPFHFSGGLIAVSIPVTILIALAAAWWPAAQAVKFNVTEAIGYE